MEVKSRVAQVTAGLGYLKPGNKKPFNLMYEPGDGAATTNCEYVEVPSVIRDGRQAEPAPRLNTHGFELVHAPSRVADFYDDAEVTTTYFAEVRRLIRQMTGSDKIKIFDHQRRQREEGKPALTFGRHGDGKRPAAVGRVHNDYTEASGLRRLTQDWPAQDPDSPFMIINLWRPLLHPAIDTPLAVCDARTVHDEDWVATDIIYPERKGEIYLATHSPRHEWYYYPEMEVDEVLLFKTFDSRQDQQARMTPHGAFDDPTAPSDAPLRRSMEVRCLVVME